VERVNATKEAFFDPGIRLKFDPYTPAKGGHAQSDHPITLTLTRRTNRQRRGTMFTAATTTNFTDRVRCIVVPFGIGFIRVRVAMFGLGSDRTRLKAVVTGRSVCKA
jgi:hypothetical protein